MLLGVEVEAPTARPDVDGVDTAGVTPLVEFPRREVEETFEFLLDADVRRRVTDAGGSERTSGSSQLTLISEENVSLPAGALSSSAEL